MNFIDGTSSLSPTVAIDGKRGSGRSSGRFVPRDIQFQMKYERHGTLHRGKHSSDSQLAAKC